MHILNKKGVITHTLTLIMGMIILLNTILPTTVHAVIPISEGGPILYTYPIPCISPPGYWTMKLSVTSPPVTIPVIYPYPGAPPIVKSKFLPPFPGIVSLGIATPGACLTFIPCKVGLCPIVLPGFQSIQYGTALGI